MECNEIKKFVFVDDGVTKVIKGTISEEDDFLFKIKTQRGGEIITIGKRAIIKISNVVGDGR